MSGLDGDQAATGGSLSRRDMIAKSAVATGLVWAAPTLLSSPAGATTGCTCVGGVKTTVKIASTSSSNCGTACLSKRASLNFPCLDDLVSCLQVKGFISFTQSLTNGQVRKARVE